MILNDNNQQNKDQSKDKLTILEKSDVSQFSGEIIKQKNNMEIWNDFINKKKKIKNCIFKKIMRTVKWKYKH